MATQKQIDYIRKIAPPKFDDVGSVQRKAPMGDRWVHKAKAEWAFGYFTKRRQFGDTAALADAAINDYERIAARIADLDLETLDTQSASRLIDAIKNRDLDSAF